MGSVAKLDDSRCRPVSANRGTTTLRWLLRCGWPVSTLTKPRSGTNRTPAQKAEEISMKTLLGCGLLLAMAALIGSANFAAAQHSGAGMAMPTNTLLVARLNAQQVVGGGSSRATGTGAFLLDPVQHTLAYSLTYQGLQAGAPKSIALYNFGKGKNGEVIKTLCGPGTQPCPGSNA